MARNRVWRAPDGPELGSLGYLSTDLIDMERRQSGGLHDLRRGRRLYIGSDYGQSFTGKKYKTYSFVITADSLTPEWNRRRSKVREELLRGAGEMGYKDLKDGVKFRALIPFLEAANALPGLSVTVAIAKDVRYLSPGRIADAYSLDADNPWKGNENAFERAQRIVHVVGLLLGGLAGPGQHVDWVTDKDEIALFPQRIEHLKRMLNSTCALYLPPSMGQLDIRTNDLDPDMFLSDFLAIPDLIAGCFSEVLNHCYEQVRTAGQDPKYFSLKEAPEKARKILDWHRKGRHPLRRAFLVVDPSGDPTYPYEFGCPDFTDPRPHGHLWSGRELKRRHAKEMPSCS